MPRGKKATPAKAAVPERKKPGPKPLTEAQKKERAKQRAEEIKKADSMVPAMILQYQGIEIDLQALVDQAKAMFKETHKRTRITDMKMYFKPEEHAAYFVINESFEEKIMY